MENKEKDMGTYEVDMKDPRTGALIEKMFDEFIGGNESYKSPLKVEDDKPVK